NPCRERQVARVEQPRQSDGGDRGGDRLAEQQLTVGGGRGENRLQRPLFPLADDTVGGDGAGQEEREDEQEQSRLAEDLPEQCRGGQGRAGEPRNGGGGGGWPLAGPSS